MSDHPPRFGVRWKPQPQPRADHAAWHTRTGHCGGCGHPGNWCHCTDRDPCDCRHLHPMGSGLNTDPAELFGVAVSDEQGELFG